MDIISLIMAELDKQIPGVCIGVAYNSRVANGDENPLDGWESGDLLGYRIDLSETASDADADAARQIVRDVSAHPENYRTSESYLQNSDVVVGIVKLMISKGVLTQTEVDTIVSALGTTG